jgi:hypothetical protein
MEQTTTSAIPEPGQFVRVRLRDYVVTDVRRGTLDVDPLAGPLAGPQHLVSLSCVEDDALGEELEVVWEIEPGPRVLEKGGLPAPVKKLDELLAAGTREPVPDGLRRPLIAAWDHLAPALDRELEAQMDRRWSSLKKTLEERAAKEIEDISAVMQELAATIEATLADTAYQQLLPTFEDLESEQLQRNRASLANRLKEIPGEIQRERENVARRYRSFTLRRFPVAVEFLVPATDTGDRGRATADPASRGA